MLYTFVAVARVRVLVSVVVVLMLVLAGAAARIAKAYLTRVQRKVGSNVRPLEVTLLYSLSNFPVWLFLAK